MRAGVTHRAEAFQLAVRARVAVRAVVLHPAVGTWVTHLAEVFHPSVRAPLMLPHHLALPRALTSALQTPRRVEKGVVALL